MEESEKRKERLNAMRTEATQTEAYTDFRSPGPGSGVLSNPLVESETANASPHRYALPRFDFYTDPMSAFSRSKTRDSISPHVSQGYYNTPPTPRPIEQGMIRNPAYHHYPAAVNSRGRGLFPAPGPYFNQSPVNSPIRAAASPSSGPHLNPPSPYNPPNLSRGSNFTSPGYSPPCVNYGQGRGHQGQNSNFHYDSGCGRGRGRSFGNNIGSGPAGRGFRRGLGSSDPVSAESRPGSYYSKEMVQDPWLDLNPVMWKGVGRLGSSDKSWLPKSISVKKSKVSPEASRTSISQQSLAEYLAASFNDTIDETFDDGENVYGEKT